MPRITFQKETVKELKQRLGQAYQAGDLRRVRRLAVLLGIACGSCLAELLRAWQINWWKPWKEHWPILMHERESF